MRLRRLGRTQVAGWQKGGATLCHLDGAITAHERVRAAVLVGGVMLSDAAGCGRLRSRLCRGSGGRAGQCALCTAGQEWQKILSLDQSSFVERDPLGNHSDKPGDLINHRAL